MWKMNCIEALDVDDNNDAQCQIKFVAPTAAHMLVGECIIPGPWILVSARTQM